MERRRRLGWAEGDDYQFGVVCRSISAVVVGVVGWGRRDGLMREMIGAGVVEVDSRVEVDGGRTL